MTSEQRLPKLSKRMKTVRGQVDRSKSYPIDEALKLVKETAVAKFDESVDVAVNLGVDAKKSDQTVRGSVVLPAGIGKNVRVAVFAQGDKAKQAKAAGADIVGFDDLAAKIKEGFMDFDVDIASPDAMKVVGQLGQILGPARPDAEPEGRHRVGRHRRRREERQGGPGAVPHRQGRHRPVHDRARVVHARAAQVNLTARSRALKARPQGIKGIYFRKVSLSSTMGAGVRSRHREPEHRAVGGALISRRSTVDRSGSAAAGTKAAN
jgi:large subunit ribosomal protein L1